MNKAYNTDTLIGVQDAYQNEMHAILDRVVTCQRYRSVNAARRRAERVLVAMGYTAEQARTAVSDARDMVTLERVARDASGEKLHSK